MKVLIYKPTQNRKTQEVINDILKNIGNSINIIFTDNLCMLGSQTSDRIIKEVNGFTMYGSDIPKTISINCESSDIEGVSRKEIATHVLGMISHDNIRNIITLTNAVRLPQMRRIIELLTEKDSWGRTIVPDHCPTINLYFDEADKTIKSITRELDAILEYKFIKDYYITATPKKVLKLYNEMKLYNVRDLLSEYISLEYANWINIGTHEYMDCLREMFNDIKRKNGGIIDKDKFIFAPGIILKDSHYEIAEEATNVFKCIGIVVNSDGFNILLPYDIDNKYLSPVVDVYNNKIPMIPEKFKTSFNRKTFPNKITKISGGCKYYNLNFNKKLLIQENENEFWKIIEVVREYWKDNPVIVTGSRCIERGITIQNPFNKKVRFTDGMLHCNISKSDSGSQMAGRFTLTYNSSMRESDFTPINIYSNEKTKIYMINQEKKAKYAVKLSNEKETISYAQWRNFERIAVLGHKQFDTFKDAIEYASRKLTNNGMNIAYNFKKDYSEDNNRIGSCNKIIDGEYKDYRYNSFDNKDKLPISVDEFRLRGFRHLCWTKGKRGNTYRIWAVYHDINDIKSLKYHLCWSPLAINDEIEESDSDTEYESAEEN
tara:strand:- start:14447 stop:16252 length:1806 start_codon:yes stop_codon:yes gene_type:complete